MKIRQVAQSILDKQSFVFKAFLFVVSILLVMYLLPKGGHFKYQFQKGKPWQYESLYAPFTYTNKKLPEEIEKEEGRIIAQTPPYFEIKEDKKAEAKEKFSELFEDAYVDTLFNVSKSQVKNIGLQTLDKAYKYGVLDRDYAYTPSRNLYLRDGKELQELVYEDLYTTESVMELIDETLSQQKLDKVAPFLKKLIARSLLPTIEIDQKLTDNVLDGQIQSINPNTGVIEKGSLIIAKGEVVE